MRRIIKMNMRFNQFGYSEMNKGWEFEFLYSHRF